MTDLLKRIIPDVVLLKRTARSSILDSPNFHSRIVRSSSGAKNARELVVFINEKALDASDLDTKGEPT